MELKSYTSNYNIFQYVYYHGFYYVYCYFHDSYYYYGDYHHLFNSFFYHHVTMIHFHGEIHYHLIHVVDIYVVPWMILVVVNESVD